MSTRETPLIPLEPLRPSQPPQLDLLDLPLIGRFLRWRHARIVVQLPLFLLALLMIWDGLTGSQLSPKNMATVFTWVHSRGVLVIVLLVVGNLFCMACPFMVVRNLARRFARPVRHWPRFLRNKWVAVTLLALFFFSYELFDLWSTPWWTAWLILGYMAVALLVDLFFDGAPFCKYVCPLGQFNMVGSLVSPFSVAVREPVTCATCQTRDCIKGNPQQRGCELWLFQPRKVGNMDCTFCLDCVHACPHDNVGIRARLPASELWADPLRSGIGHFSQRPDLAALVAVFTFGALINAFGMVTPVYALESWLANRLATRQEAPVLGIIFAIGLIIEPLVLLGLAGWLTQRQIAPRQPLLTIVTRYSFALVPLGVGIWTAHYAYHFLSGFWTFIPVVQYVLADLGWPILGAPQWTLGPIVATVWLTPLEWGFIGLGCFGACLTALQIARSEDAQHPWRRAWPWVALILLLTVSGMWLMSLPMDMRATMLGG